jgi:hypothetical protein
MTKENPSITEGTSLALRGACINICTRTQVSAKEVQIVPRSFHQSFVVGNMHTRRLHGLLVATIVRPTHVGVAGRLKLTPTPTALDMDY